jgi:tRNA A-37 threonylcarbamoyl transferase component Bud32
MSGLLALNLRQSQPDFLDLPFGTPLAKWPGLTERLVEVQRGLSRHEVLFVNYGTGIYALKELPISTTEREYEMLLALEERGMPSVIPIGYARVRTADGEEQGVLITRYLEASLPYRTLFQQPGLARYRERLLDAMAGLLVRLHLAGFYWGDCSLSNTLFRRDAGELTAYLVDAETTERHDDLGDGARRQDLMILEENITGDLADLAAIAELPGVLDVYETGDHIRRRYDSLWLEINRTETIPVGERWRIQERVRKLNALGFTVGEIELEPSAEGDRLRMRTIVTDRDYHRHQFHNLTGLIAGEKQAELMLNEIRELRATLIQRVDRSMPLSIAVVHWLRERWEPAMSMLAPLLANGGDGAELYCQVLEHKWFLSERAQLDVGFEAAAKDYVAMFRGKAEFPRDLSGPDVV